ncbi:MAG: tetratricopeptide repeat-containing sensor histidine kinase [Ignavibacteriaceae bacterium]
MDAAIIQELRHLTLVNRKKTISKYMNKIILNVLVFFIVLTIYAYAQSEIEIKTQILIGSAESSEGDARLEAYSNLLNYMVKTAPDQSIKYAEAALKEARLSGNRSAESNYLLQLGTAYTKLHKPLIAQEYFDKAYLQYKEAGDSVGLCIAMNKLGYIKIVMGDMVEAINYFHGSEEISLKFNEMESYIDALNYLGILNYILDNIELAESYSEKALNLSIEHRYQEGEALAYEHKAIIYLKQNKYDKALELNTRSYEIRKRLDDITMITELYDNYSSIYNRMNNFERAIEYTKKSIELRRQYGDLNGMGSTYMNLGNIYLALNNYDEALKYLLQAYQIKKESQDLRAFTMILRNLSDIYEKKNDFRNAYTLLREFRTYNDSLFGENIRRQVSRIEAKQELVKKENEIKTLQEKNLYQQDLQKFLIVIIILGVFLIISLIIAFILNRRATKKLNYINEEILEQRNKLQILNNELVVLNNDREKFFKIIAHDLRSPFFPLLTYSELIATEADTLTKSELTRYSKNIYQSSKNIFNLLENLLQWLGINSGKMNLAPTIVNIDEAIDKIIQLYKRNAADKGVKINYDYNRSLSVYADRDMVGLILRNLISNAIKYTKKDDVITIKTELDNDFVEVSVSDTGVGINDESLKNLFSTGMYSTSGTNNESGSGLGLLLCKEMVVKNGGTIDVFSKVGEGTTFKFTLPADKNIDYSRLENS